MRIISGALRGKRLNFPKNVRPTQNKVRKAFFDILGDFVKDCDVLELFAGSGSVGIEAFSYGAKDVTFVDNDVRCLKIIEDNLKNLGLVSYRLYKMDSIEAVDFLANRGQSFDLIFLDPPYGQGLAKNSLLRLGACDILNPSGFVVLEHSKREELPGIEGGLTLYKRKKYGEAFLSIYDRRVKR